MRGAEAEARTAAEGIGIHADMEGNAWATALQYAAGEVRATEKSPKPPFLMGQCRVCRASAGRGFGSSSLTPMPLWSKRLAYGSSSVGGITREVSQGRGCTHAQE